MIFNKIRTVILQQIKRGATAQGLAMTCGFALSLGTIPLLGTSTFLCFIFGHIFKLNHPLMQAVNYLIYPLQIIFIPIFLYIGETILQVPHLSINPSELIQQFTSDYRLFFANFGMAGLHAVLAWLLISPVLGLICYLILHPVFKKLKRVAT